MKNVKVYIEPSTFGFSAYMDDTPLSYSCLGEGKTINQTVNDFNLAYAEMKDYYELETNIRYAAQPWDKTSGCNGDVLPYRGQIQLKLGAYETKIMRRRSL